ncbi:SDR family NAD(P)-dependent oxidoreductase [Actinosynnema sp. NPDC050436]|uniref:SDR family NAD(P)-dependent oxidoreductase n=1 Tax=Actinosynnema sp. NPDC050436 TaxID=3155659 RepID=UPI0033C04272
MDRPGTFDDRVESIAVVGVGLRLPGGLRTMDELWDALAKEKDLVGELASDRFDVERFVSPGVRKEGKSDTGAAGLLDGIDRFDARYFGISPKEASRIDPQQRLLLECAVEAFDDAGIDPDGLRGGDTAVIVGCASHDYADLQTRRRRTTNAYTMGGGAVNNTANRVSYAFDLRGPSFAVDTACSSSLTAVHHACEVLRTGRSGAALAGGVNVLLSPHSQVGFAQATMLSPTGRCKPFSALADGYVRAEGAAVLLLKPLQAALADGDRVHVVIVASGINSDGRTQGLSLPSEESQAELIRLVHGSAGVEPHRVAYVEAHGTGTPAGDPIECSALGSVLGARGGAQPVPIGSVKSNLGHLEAASGVAGLLKAALVLREKTVPATLHAEPVNEAIDFDGLGLTTVVKARPLRGGDDQVVCVNSFGFGGSNAHAILAAPPASPQSGQVRTSVPIVVSARTPEALSAAAQRWADHLDGVENGAWYDTAYTSCRRRGRHEHRLVALAADPASAAAGLRASAAGRPQPGTASSPAVEHGAIGFVFTGNGSQWAGMGAELLAGDDVFRAEVEAVDRELAPWLGWSVLELMKNAGPGDRRVERTEFAQPLLFAVQAGLVAALAARGVRPAAVLGHSVGEVAAAYCAGALDRAEACRVIAVRSRNQARTAGTGRMAAVGLGAAEIEGRLAAYAGRLALAAVNSPRDVTVSGDVDALADFGAALGSEGVFFRDLELDYAFHSEAMDPIRRSFLDELAGVDTTDASIPLISTVTGRALGKTPADADYWWRNLREPVQFERAVRTLVRAHGCDVLVEIGPHPVLRTYLRRAAGARAVAVLPTLSRTAADVRAVDTAVAYVIAAGGTIDWAALFPAEGRVVSLPAYPWQRERHWNGAPDWWAEEASQQGVDDDRHPLLGTRRPGPEPVWQQQFEPGSPGWLADHRVGDSVVLPAAAYIDMALSSGRSVFDAPAEIIGITFHRALELPVTDPDMDVRVNTALSADGVFRVHSGSGDGSDWVEHSKGHVQQLLRDRPPVLDVTGIRARLDGEFVGDEHYALCARLGLVYGPHFRTLVGGRVGGEGECLAEYAAHTDPGRVHVAHPTILDGALQATVALVGSTGQAFLPASAERVCCWERLPATGLIHARERFHDDREAVLDVTVTHLDGTVVLELLGCRLRRFDGNQAAEPIHVTEVLRAAPLPGTPAPPSPVPPPEIVLHRAKAELAALDATWQDNRYPQAQAGLRELSSHFTAAALREILPDRRSIALEDLFEAGVDRKHTRFLRTLLRSAERHGVVVGAGPDRWDLPDRPQHQRSMRTFLRDFPADSVDAVVFGVCGRNLADVLRGVRDPLKLLVSEADALAARLWDGWPVLRHHNKLARQLLREVVAGWPGDRCLRILEVGAGTGGLTASLLPELPAERTHYTFTDVSPAFFTRARSRFAAYDFIDYRQLDLDSDPHDQGFSEASYDLVVASNVLHATKDLGATLDHLRRLTADGGHLLALESHNLELLAPVFGMLDSFWSAQDPVLRPDGPLLPRERWAPLLAEHGFTGTVQTGDSTEPGRNDFSVILAARSPRAVVATGTAASDAAPSSVVVVGEGAAVLHDAVITELDRRASGVVRSFPLTDDPTCWDAVLNAEPEPLDVVLLLDEPRDDLSPAQVTEEAVRRIGVLRGAMVALERLPEHRRPTLWLVHCTVEEVPVALSPSPSCVGSALWGAARSAANEHPGTAVRRISLAYRSESSGSAVRDLVAELHARQEDDEVLLTGAGRFVTRVRPVPTHPVPSACDTAPYALALDRPGPQYQLDWRPLSVPEPGDGEVVVEVRAAALNYRDVLLAMGMVPPMADRRGPGLPSLGCDFAGVVRAVGPGVTAFSAGDRVAGATMGCLGSHTVADAHHLFPIPDPMGFAEASTMPTVFLTAIYGLKHLARLGSGETVLVHGGAGGVGLAALQIAENTGARVIATAGTPAKRDLLRLLDVDHVHDSRGLRFADELHDPAGGGGVDVVLNSLAGEGMVRSLRALKPHGRFVELGKRDFLDDNSLPLAPFLHNIAFFGVDVSAMLAGSTRIGPAVEELGRAVRGGSCRPLPFRSYAPAEVQEAFTSLQHSRHIGKIVITFDEPAPLHQPLPPMAADPHATYLITGGLGGFGAATARHLAARGARHLTLLGRRGDRSPEAPALLEDLAGSGVEVAVHAVDAADGDALRAVFDDLYDRRLAGVVHAAMVLDDAPLTELTDERVRTVLAPKLTAGLHLDALTRHRELDFFVVYSSVSALMGNLLQSAYTGANSAMEAMVRARRRSGLPGLAVQWGAIADAGYVQRTGMEREISAAGIGLMPGAQALSVLDHLLGSPDPEVVAVGHFDWGAAHRFMVALSAPRTRELLSSHEDSDTDDSLLADLAQASPEHVVLAARSAVAEVFGHVLQLPADQVDHDRRPDQMGVDSLMGAEISTRIRRRFGCEVPVLEVLGAADLTALTQRILTRLGHSSAHPTA